MKFKKSLSLLLMASILITTLFSYPIFADGVSITISTEDTAAIEENGCFHVPEGGTVQLSATTTPSGEYVDWYCGSSYASVDGNGLVTGLKAGTATIIATVLGSGGTEYTAECTVYVYVPNGVYYIQNSNSEYYLHVDGGRISDFTNVILASQMSGVYAKIARQMWKISYLGQGRYSVRPYHKLDMGLDVTDNNVDIYHIGTTDTLDEVPYYCQWSIQWGGSGYMLLNDNSRYLTMQAENASTSNGANVIATTYSNNNNCRWILSKISSPPAGVYWYDINNNNVLGTSIGNKSINCGSNLTAEDLGVIPILYSPSSNDQSFVWTSSDVDTANVEQSSGLITGREAGNVTITATSAYGGYNLLLNLKVKSMEPFHHSNIQYMRYLRITGTNWWGLGSDTDHTISIVKSSLYSYDYCIIHDNINQGYYREIYINNELKNMLNSLEDNYQDHYSFIPAFDTTTDQENAAHSSKGETDQLVEAGYFAENSSEYYGVWAYNYVSTLNLIDYWRGAIDTATAVYGVYLTATTFYTSYLMSTTASSMQVTSSQYSNTVSVIDDIDDAMSGMNYNNKITLSSDARNITLSQQGYTDPLPYQPQTPVVQYQQTSSSQYVRVFANGNKTGRWLMKYSDIQGLTPAQIQSKFALPSMPTHYCYVDVPAGTTVYVGIVNQSSVSGTLQYELGTIIPDSAFGTEILLP